MRRCPGLSCLPGLPLGQLPATLLYSWLGQSVSGDLRAVFWAFSIAAALAVLSVAIAPHLRRRFGAEAGE